MSHGLAIVSQTLASLQFFPTPIEGVPSEPARIEHSYANVHSFTAEEITTEREAM